MNALVALSPTPANAAPPRAVGGLRLVVSQDRGASHIRTLRQSGSLKALFPRPVSAALEAVFLNTAGGLTGGDRMQIAATAETGAQLILTSQAAERVYRTVGSSRAEVDLDMAVEPSARIDWLPQETIMFDGAALVRRLHVNLAADSQLLLVEPLIFGRAAMGETVRSGLLRDTWRVHRNGELVFADALLFQGDVAAALRRSGIAGGAGAMASVLYVGPDAAARLSGLRQLMLATAGCSLIRDGVLFTRMLAGDGFDLRRMLIPVVEYLSNGPLPKVWRL